MRENVAYMQKMLYLCALNPIGMKHISCFAILFCLLCALPLSANRDWVKMKAEAANTKVVISRQYKPATFNLQYFNQTTQAWTNVATNSVNDITINLPAIGDSVMFRGQNPTGLSKVQSGERKFIKLRVTAGKASVSGDIMTLVDTTETVVTTVPGDGCFYRLFEGVANLTSAEGLVLSARFTNKAAYKEMFSGCIGLTAAPDMSALEQIDEEACYKMFYNCAITSSCEMPYLVTVGVNGCQLMYQRCRYMTHAYDLMAKYVDTQSYASMFYECTSLTHAPQMYAYEMHRATCIGMFKSCSSLIYAPDLTIQLLDDRCYESMFEGCSSLVNAPVLKATDLGYQYGNKMTPYADCYKWMFKGCTSLRFVEVYFSKWRDAYPNTADPTGVWMQNVTQTTEGVFSAPCDLPDKRGNSYIQTKWQFHCFRVFLFDVYTNGGVWEDDHDDYSNRAFKEEELDLSTLQAYRENYRFVGWNTEPDGSGTAFDMAALPDETTVYYAVFVQLVPDDPSVTCIDYTNLSDASVTCDTSNLSNSNVWNNWHTAYVDYGPRNRLSRHTIHHHPAERDMRTNGQLHTSLPDGKPAVRLGNWNKKGRERITYTYTVPADEGNILLLHYAAVLENPASHASNEQPRFTLELYEQGHSDQIETCFNFDYISGQIAEDPNWHTERGNLCWKDWTTTGINLRDYAGKTVNICLTTYDCKQGGHYGYAYFGLECSNGEMKTISCGTAEETTFRAPEGFNYRWYREGDPDNILGTERTFTVTATGGETYLCDVISLEVPECFFTLRAVPETRYPLARFDTARTTLDDAVLLHTTNLSAVSNDGTTPKTPHEDVDGFRWTLSKKATGEVVATSNLEAPDFHIEESGTYLLTLQTWLNNADTGICESDEETKEIVILLPDPNCISFPGILVPERTCMDD